MHFYLLLLNLCIYWINDINLTLYLLTNENEEAHEIIKEVNELIDGEKKKKKARLPIPASIRPLQPEVPLAVWQQYRGKLKTDSKPLEIKKQQQQPKVTLNLRKRN